MKELANYFNRRYSAVSTQDECNLEALEKRRKSLNPNRSINQGFHIVDSFFSERSQGKRTRSPKCAFLLLASGLLAITAAVLVKIFQPYDLIFKYKLVFEKGGEIFGLWEKPPVDLYLKVYLFNITNAEAFLAGREKMNVEEVGPYVYKELMTHENVTFNENGTVSAIPRHPLVWQEELSGGRKEDDVVIMLNIAMLSLAQVVQDRAPLSRLFLNLLYASSSNEPIVRMTAREFMFGFKSPLTTLGNTFLPGWIHFEKVGLIDRMYDFDTDYETFHTGIEDPSISGLYATYLGSPNLAQWDGEHCSNINLASDGTKFKSFIQPNESVLFFRKSMCRPQNLIRAGNEIVVNNLVGYKYVFEENAFDNGEIEEKNKCFCRKGKCQPRGLIDVTDCYYGFPISLSYPHFMDADPGLANNVTGLMPNEDKHSSYFIIQPDSGLPLAISVKIQINMHMRDVGRIKKLGQFADHTFPMLWFEITMKELPTSLGNRFNFYLNILPLIDPVGFWGGLILGIAFLLFAVTKATVKMSHFTNISDKAYGKSNLRSGVYSPCEMKLIEANEKGSHGKNELKTVTVPVDGDIKDVMYEIDLKGQTGNYLLENEPALSDVDADDDDNASDTLSQRTSSGMDEDYLTDETDRSAKKMPNEENMATRSFGSSGFESAGTSEGPSNWPASDSAILLDNVATELLPPLRIVEEGDEDHTHSPSLSAAYLYRDGTHRV